MGAMICLERLKAPGCLDVTPTTPSGADALRAAAVCGACAGCFERPDVVASDCDQDSHAYPNQRYHRGEYH